MKYRRGLLAIAGICLWSVLLIGSTHADPIAPAHASPDKGADLLRLMLIGPTLFLLFASSYAIVLSVSVMARAEVPLARLIENCSERLSESRPLLTLWGLAVVVLVIAVSVLLIKTHGLAIVGILLLIAGLALSGTGLATTAAQMGGRWSDASGEQELPLGSRIGRGFVIVAGTSVIPIVGWIVAALSALGGVGAVVERLIAKRH